MNGNEVDDVQLTFRIIVESLSGLREIDCRVARLLCAGFTGRDRGKVIAHIKELAELNIPEPPEIPTIYRISLDRLYMGNTIEVQTSGTSGEVEVVLLTTADDIFVTVGSDHTDRDVERQSIEKAKQCVPKICSNRFWKYSDVKEHWDALMLRAWIEQDGKRKLYQEGSVSSLLLVEDLLDVISLRTEGMLTNNVIFSGTLAAVEGLRPSDRFWMELEDPVLKRKLSHEYSVEKIPGAY